MNSSSTKSPTLIVVASANKIYPYILKNITSKTKALEIVTLVRVNNNKDAEDYCDKNGCVAFSPLGNVALLIPANEFVRLANCSSKPDRKWNVDKMEYEKMDGSQPWVDCSLVISTDGYLGLALDRRGKLVLIKFTMQ